MEDTGICTLIRFDNNTEKKIKGEEQLFYASRSGVKFIPLVGMDTETKEARYGNHEIRLRGFQRCELSLTSSGGQVRPSIVYETSREGKPVGVGVLVFSPDKIGQLRAPLLDTPYNRNKLVASYFHFNKNWIIDDARIDTEIKEEAMSQGLHLEKRTIDTDVMVKELVSEKSALEQRNEELEKELQKLKDREAIITSSAEKEPEPVKKPKKKKLENAVHKKAKEEVLAENDSLLESIKDECREKGQSTWWISKRYRDEIVPLIKQRYERLVSGNDNEKDNNGA